MHPYLCSVVCVLGLLLGFAALPAGAGGLDFTLHRLGEDQTPGVLVVGGIQGDEPGGFSAATLLITHYRIKKGTVWVVPNLNFPSIIQSESQVLITKAL